MGISIAIEVIFILALILFNGVLALAEIAVVSARRARLQSRANEGDQGAQAALALNENPSGFLSTVQVGITLVGVLAGAFGGATIAEQLANLIMEVDWLRPYSEGLAVTIVVLAITYLSLIFGELVPKRLGFNNPEKVAAMVARPMQSLSRLVTPFVWLLTRSTDGVLRLMRVKLTVEPPVTEDEIKLMLAEGTQAGIFIEAEQAMVERVFRLADWRVGTLLTPRTEVVWVDLDDPLEENLAKIRQTMHTRIPASRGNLDNVFGILRAKDLMDACLAGEPVNLEALMVEPLLVPESMPALQVMEKFKETRMHMALVIDEYGGLQGLVTVNDILEAIVGEIPQRGEADARQIIAREDGTWLVDGMLSVDELKDYFDFSSLPDEEVADFQTVGGFMMTALGRVPAVTDKFQWAGYHFEIVDMDGMRVDKILIRKENHP